MLNTQAKHVCYYVRKHLQIMRKRTANKQVNNFVVCNVSTNYTLNSFNTLHSAKQFTRKLVQRKHNAILLLSNTVSYKRVYAIRKSKQAQIQLTRNFCNKHFVYLKNNALYVYSLNTHKLLQVINVNLL